MAAKKFALAICAISFLQTSFAGFDRLWLFAKDANTEVSSWEKLSEAEQAAAIKRYQDMKELPNAQGDVLQQRLDWFTQLPEQDKQHMREIWQKMSSSERRELAQRLERAAPEQRASIREEYMQKHIQTSPK